MKVVVSGGTVVTPHGRFAADITCEDGAIRAIGSEASTASADERVDARGMLVYPGFIDPHVHSRDPGATHKEDFAHSTRGAAAGGTTTILEMPNAVPPVTDVATFHARAAQHAAAAHVDFGLWGMSLGSQNLAEVRPLFEAGIVALKLFWGYALDKKTKSLVYNTSDQPPENLIPPPDNGEVLELFATVAKLGGLLAAHCEDRGVLEASLRNMHRPIETYADLLEARPASAENAAIALGAEFAAATGCRFHVLHLASGRGAHLIRQRQAEGVPISGETCAHYLSLSDDMYPDIGSLMKVYPPIRTRADQQRLIDAVNDGTLCSIGSDHAPHTADEKARGFATGPAGFAGVQTLPAIMLDLVARGALTPERLSWALSEGTARLYGLYPKKGAILPGADADFTIVDPNGSLRVDNAKLHAKHPLSPWHGRELRGRVKATILRGQTIARDGEVLGTPGGKLVRPLVPAGV